VIWQYAENQSEGMMSTDNTIRACLLFICFFLAIYGLHVTQDLLAPFALAVFIGSMACLLKYLIGWH